ncbi:MAG: type II toxin-antitoxin system RelE/ParE family toxin [Nitrosomonadales bacterium]|nr:type II toxin-antitoxin system RelE/ParE family toxin [Nitrosomonadales bacterium]
MDTRVSWSPEALDDVDAIAAYIAKDSPFYASAVVRKILEAAQSLERFPNVGPIVPEIGEPAFRERFVYSYRLIYRVTAGQVLVVAVVHGKRLLTPALIGLE